MTDSDSSNDFESAATEVRQQIAAGESASVEFKSSLRHDYRTNAVNRDLTKVVVKTLAGFLNADGGTLLIGVNDEGSVVGIESDMTSLSKKNVDGFEMALRNAMALYLGVEISPLLGVQFIDLEGRTIARVACPPHHEPVFLRDAERQEFYVRDGNQTRPFDVRAAHKYIRSRWTPEPPPQQDAIRQLLSASVGEHLRPLLEDIVATALQKTVHQTTPSDQPVTQPGQDRPPEWIKIATRRVLDLFLSSLARSPGWKRIYLISPWLSGIEHSASITSTQFCKRLQEDGCTVYVVTRPPAEEWHKRELERLGETGRANIALVPGLHIKLYTALTTHGSFAMLGSANFTQQALMNREIGLLVNSYGDGRRLVSELNHEAATIYRFPERRLLYRASFRQN
jgi:hypothetical protein